MSIQEAEQAAARNQPPAAETSAPAQPEPTAATTLPATITEPLVNANDAQVTPVAGDRGDATTASESQALLSQDVEMGDEDEEDEEAAIARAIAMSLENPEGNDDKESK